MIFFHPADTQKYVNPPEIDNFALRYNYFLNYEKKSGKYKFVFPKNIKMPQVAQDIIRELRLRQELQVKSLNLIYDFRAIEAAVDWRLIVGLGGGHVRETGMTLHHVYGIPYIPGSAVKGVLRHWAQDMGSEDEIFGTRENKGDIIFMDAFPVSEVIFATDIMNTHYPDYYGGEKYPTDCQNPVPINFLAVDEKTVFRFIFLAGKPDYLDKIASWIGKIFEDKGLGSKTAVGYGYFDNLRDITEKLKENFEIRQTTLAEQKKTVSISPADQLCAELKTLKNENRSYDIFNQELDQFAGEDRIKLANALKEYWEKINKWKKGSKNQKEKVRKIKEILGL